MTEHRPPACRYDRHHGERVTTEHRQDCPDPSTHRGCAPCTAPHCLVCGRNHADNDHPSTCPKCIGLIKTDLTDLRDAYTALAIEATDGGGDGHLVAAAPIPGGNAAVLVGPTVRLDVMRVSRAMRENHRGGDPLPALAVLAQWEDIYRAWLGHNRPTTATTLQRGTSTITVPARASLNRAVTYLVDQIPYLANHLDGTEPDWFAFVAQVRRLRANAERVLHDEREHEEGVECFECGDRLERRFRVARHCTHTTEARAALQAWVTARNGAQDYLRDVIGSYPELDGPRREDLDAAQAPPASLIAAARKPCPDCAVSSGGIDNPEPGRSWECPGCRKEYDPGEYATAVRRSLLEQDDADGWCTIVAAADAAADITGRPVSAPMIRTWIDRGDNIGVCCMWRLGQRIGVQLVFWPDVLDRANEVRGRGRRPATSERIGA